VPSSIPIRSAQFPVISPGKTIVIDEGIINPMTVARKPDDGFEVTVINGRAARALKDRRNGSVAELRSLMSKCAKGSLQWRRYNKVLKRANAEAKAGLRNIDHQVSHKVAQIVHEHGDRENHGRGCARDRETNQSIRTASMQNLAPSAPTAYGAAIVIVAAVFSRVLSWISALFHVRIPLRAAQFARSGFSRLFSASSLLLCLKRSAVRGLETRRPSFAGFNGRRSKFSKNDEMFIDEERLKGSTQGSFQPRAFKPRPLVRRLADRLILNFKEENAGKTHSR
jgi:hypothetical protein